MKRKMLFLALILLGLTMPLQAQPSAQGNVRFILDDGQTKTVEFAASKDEKGTTTGSLTFTDSAKVPDTDDPESPSDAYPISLKAQIDDSTFEKNRAILIGTVVDSTHKAYLGKRLQFVVEDNSDDKLQDRITWMFCGLKPGGWIPSDAELKDDDGAYLHWWATDAERKDDVGIPSVDLLPKEGASCAVLAIWSYEFPDLWKWEGDIIVKP